MVHARQHSGGFLPSDKTMLSHHSNTMCGYSPSATNAGAGINSGNWSINSSQTFNGVDSYVNDDQQSRWMVQQEMNMCRRERRSDCRAHSQHTEQHPIQADFSASSFLESTQLPRSSAFQPIHTRSPMELQPSASGWNTWETENNHPTSLNAQRFDNGPSSWNSHLNVQIPQYSSNAYGDMLFSSSDSSSATLFTPHPDQSIPLNGFAFPHRFSPGPSPSPSPVQHVVPSTSSSPYHSRRNSEDRSEAGKSCSHCHATSTPLWRRDPSTMKPLCNACGLYLQQRNKLRPQELIDADDDGSTSDESDANYVGPECSHCRTHHTSVWRRSKTGDQLCNACGVYARLRGKPRPLSLKRNKIRPRSKHSPK
ncbi:hypothetical protein GALMADRAFT_111818 [Galerina marginata CBS 339.88]|uniref:GATA-type domain-containing protein n=1 Tax=Galerina marginata (strain CBS 339.88) TaxID=685588 RepID=A0A067TX24_GALM3|nr:hypothetical protein GALMADRAFT_111818 [Galerina marginata CBS 339.88]